MFDVMESSLYWQVVWKLGVDRLGRVEEHVDTVLYWHWQWACVLDAVMLAVSDVNL